MTRLMSRPPTPRRILAPRRPPAVSSFDAVVYAREYLADHGLAVVPIVPGTKKPHVGWKRFQTRRPSQEDLAYWWGRWPDAGIGCVLGPVSGILAVDVDGPAAHAALVARLGAVPAAPKVLTGSRKPDRYQLLFRHPSGLDTGAKYTPWHPALEFRGTGGLSVLPRSRHKSGKRYDWARGLSLDDLPPPDLPGEILDALRDRVGRPSGAESGTPPSDLVPPADLDRVQRRALSLIQRHVRAVAGRGGDKATFTAACYLVIDFNLTVEQALPVITAWNRTNCDPLWDVAGLRHKLREADKRPGPKGGLVNERSASAGAPPGPAEAVPAPIGCPPAASPAPDFAVPVPDSVLADWTLVQPQPPTGRRGRPAVARRAVAAMVRAAVVLQRCSTVRLPDVALGQLFWGGDRGKWPVRWRDKLRRRLKAVTGLEVDLTPCSPACPMHGRPGVRHKDVRVTVKDTKRPAAN